MLNAYTGYPIEPFAKKLTQYVGVFDVIAEASNQQIGTESVDYQILITGIIMATSVEQAPSLSLVRINAAGQALIHHDLKITHWS